MFEIAWLSDGQVEMIPSDSRIVAVPIVWRAVLMGTYLNPGNKGFQEILQSEYVDKTSLIALVNKTVGTMEKLSCISRPRRFGKSYAAKMLCAYYDCSCDSHGLFDDKEIAQTEGYLAHLNQYHVISLDVAGFVSMVKKQHKALGTVPELIEKRIYEELVSFYRGCKFFCVYGGKNLPVKFRYVHYSVELWD